MPFAHRRVESEVVSNRRGAAAELWVEICNVSAAWTAVQKSAFIGKLKQNGRAWYWRVELLLNSGGVAVVPGPGYGDTLGAGLYDAPGAEVAASGSGPLTRSSLSNFLE